MLFFKPIKSKIVFTLILIFTVSVITAQTTAPVSAQPVAAGYNQLAVLLIILILVLAFVIWGMGQVLTALGRQLVDKGKVANKVVSIVLLLGLSLLSQFSFAQDVAAPSVVETAPNYGGLSASAYFMFLTIIGVEVIVILFLAFSIRRMYTELLPEKEKSKLDVSWFSM